MPVMATDLIEYSNEVNSKTYSITGHTVAKPQLLIQKRKVGSIGQASSTDTIDIVYGTAGPDGTILPGRVTFGISVRRPVDADNADVLAALAVFRDVVQSDEFADTVNTQNFLKS